MYRTERMLSKQLRKWVSLIHEAGGQSDPNASLSRRLRRFRVPDGRIIPRNSTERELYTMFKDVKEFITTYRSRATAPYGVGEALAERCKMTLNSVKRSYLTAA